MFRKKDRRIFFVAAGAVLWATLVWPQTGWAVTKLFLKNGSFELVTSYEVQGDRVRFYSVERSDWEEVPLELVDLKATERVQEEEKAKQQKELQEAREIDKERFEPEAPKGFEVAPGVRLPGDEGVFAFDGRRVIRLVQSSTDVVKDKKRLAMSLALPGPLLKNRALVVLPGPKAAVRFQGVQPVFYVQLADHADQEFELVPVTSGRDKRVIEKIQSGIGVGKSGEMRGRVPIERKQIAPALFQLKPSQPLTKGEYALAELIQEKMSLDVWDFGID